MNYLFKTNYLIVIFGLFLVASCDPKISSTEIDPAKLESINDLQFNPTDIESEFSKEVEVFSEDGKSSMTLNIGANNEDVLNSILGLTTFKLNVITNDLEVLGQQDSGLPTVNAINEEFVGDISIRVAKLELADKSLGFSLDIEFDKSEVANSRLANWSYTIDYDSPDRWMYWGRVDQVPTTNPDSDIQVNWYYRPCGLCSMSYDYAVILGSGGSSIYHKSGERRIRAKIRSNWINYRVYFRKWETDPWRQTYLEVY